MNFIKTFPVLIVTLAMLSACGMNNNSASSPAPSAAHTDAASGSPENGNGADSVMDDAGNAVKDAGDAVGGAAKGVGDAAGDAAEGITDAAGDMISGR